MTDQQAKERTDRQIESFYARGYEMVERSIADNDEELRQTGLRLFIAGMAIAENATKNAMNEIKKTTTTQ